MIVVDTKVMVHLVSGRGEPGERAAALLRADAEWAAPAILPSELRNVLLGFVRRGWAALTDVQDMHRDALAVLQERIAAPDGGAVLATAAETGLSAYDAEFVVLARRLRVPLVSLDRAILEAAPETARPL